MCTYVFPLLVVCVVAGYIHIAPVVSQCTTEHCLDVDVDTRVLAAAISRLQDTVEHMQRSMEKQGQQLKTLKDRLKRQMVADDCQGLLRYGYNVSGVYDVYVDRARKFVQVYCDMETDGGGWLVFQRRQDGSVNFYRDWTDYKVGFGDLKGEFWLGNDLLHAITSRKQYTLRIDLGDFEDAHRYAIYQSFRVSSESEKFRVSFGKYSGTAADSFSREVGSAFSTKDRDNDVYTGHCAQMYKGGWWYKSCHEANLNGLYLRGSHASYADGIEWRHWHGYHYSLKKVVMMLRP